MAIDIGDVCRTAIDLHLALATTKGIELCSRLDLPPSGESHVLLDEVKVFEIVNNLLSNALKFTQSGFVELAVRLDLSTPSPYPSAVLNIQVRDSGSGIPRSDHDKVFIPFFQRSETSDRRIGGTGLGLSIVKELVGLLGGRIELQSAEGQGSVFRVGIPVEIAVAFAAPAVDVVPPQASAPGPASILRASLRPPAAFQGRLLLVDDNELNALLASKLLEAMGFEVIVAGNGVQALDAFEGGTFDIVLMDCQMPVMDGYEATKRIREFEQSRRATRTPVIAITAYAMAGDREKCLACGMDDHLGKPYALNDLRPKLTRWLRSTP